MATSSEKSVLRHALIARREALPTAERQRRSAALCRHLAPWLEDQGLRQALIFHPVRGEPDLRALADLCPGVTLGLPVVEPAGGGLMTFHAWRPGQSLKLNRYGIAEPDTSSPRLQVDEYTALLVPCLAHDDHGGRLGYGGGFYDRFLGKSPDMLAVAVLFDEFVVGEVPHEEHDVCLSWRASDAGVKKL